MPRPDLILPSPPLNSPMTSLHQDQLRDLDAPLFCVFLSPHFEAFPSHRLLFGVKGMHSFTSNPMSK